MYKISGVIVYLDIFFIIAQELVLIYLVVLGDLYKREGSLDVRMAPRDKRGRLENMESCGYHADRCVLFTFVSFG